MRAGICSAFSLCALPYIKFDSPRAVLPFSQAAPLFPIPQKRRCISAAPYAISAPLCPLFFSLRRSFRCFLRQIFSAPAIICFRFSRLTVQRRFSVCFRRDSENKRHTVFCGASAAAAAPFCCCLAYGFCFLRCMHRPPQRSEHSLFFSGRWGFFSSAFRAVHRAAHTRKAPQGKKRIQEENGAFHRKQKIKSD